MEPEHDTDPHLRWAWPARGVDSEIFIRNKHSGAITLGRLVDGVLTVVEGPLTPAMFNDPLLHLLRVL